MTDTFFFEEARRQTIAHGQEAEINRRVELILMKSLDFAMSPDAPKAQTPADFAAHGTQAFQEFAEEMLVRLYEDRKHAKAGGFNTWHREVLLRVWNAMAHTEPELRQAELMHTAAVCLAWVWWIDRDERRKTAKPD